MSHSPGTNLSPIAVDSSTPPDRSDSSRRANALSTANIGGFHTRLSQTVWLNGEGNSALARCLCTLFLALDPAMEVARVVEALPRRGEGVDTVDIINSLANLGYQAKSARLRPRDIDPRLLPCLYIPEGGSSSRSPDAFVLLDHADSQHGAMNVYEGQSGKVRLVREADGLLDAVGTAYFFHSIATDEPAESLPKYRRSEPGWFRRTFFRFSSTLWWLVVLGFVLNTVALATPMAVMLIYDRVIAPQSIEPLPMLAAGLAGGILLEWRLRSLRSKALAWLTARLDYVIGTSIFERLVLLAPSFVERAAVSAQMARIKTFESVRDFFSGPVFLAVIELPAVFISIIAISCIAGALVFVPLVIAILYVVVFLTVRHFVAAAIREAAKHSSITQQFAIETFEKLEALRTLGLQDAWASKYADISGREQASLARLYFLGSVGEALGHGLSIVAAVATLSVGVQLIWASSISVGVLIATMILVWRVLMPFYSLCQMIPRFEQTRNSIIQIDELMELEPEAAAEAASTRIMHGEGAISMRSVSLRYGRETGPVFIGLNVNIRPGEVVAITGPSGAGKSSVLKLVQGLYAPQVGAIFLDGCDMRQLMVRDVRRLIAYLPQQPHLLSGTIADNLRIVRPLASEDELWAALSRAGADKEVAALPGGLHTHVDDCVALASRRALTHRIALARALLQRSAFLLLDEIPSSLMASGLGDTLADIIKAVRGKQTLLFVTHRGDHARLADKVITLQPGGQPRIESAQNRVEKVA